jgi:transcriptional regulator with XRE-family HTH domain
MAVKAEATEFVSNLPGLRQRVGMTQRELALELDVTEATVQNWESGRVGATQIRRVLDLCEYLGCELQDLVEPSIETDESGTPITCYLSNIQAVRKAKGIKQRQVAIVLQVTERTIKAWEKGEAGLDVIIRMIQLCQLFNCEATDLIQRKADEESVEIS